MEGYVVEFLLGPGFRGTWIIPSSKGERQERHKGPSTFKRD